MAAGIFIIFSAQASNERETDRIPFWMTLKSYGELNPKYSCSNEYQKEMLEGEGMQYSPRQKKYLLFCKGF